VSILNFETFFKNLRISDFASFETQQKNNVGLLPPLLR
jgi:hypothetical protein